MRRAPIVLTATAAGLAATLGFTPHARSGPLPATVTASHAPAPSRPRSSSAAPAVVQTLTSDVIATRYGNVQLRVTVSGAKITDVQALQLPWGDPKSSQITTYAAPMLRQSALTKQSARIDAVSGATYTSGGYASALQSALDKAPKASGARSAVRG